MEGRRGTRAAPEDFACALRFCADLVKGVERFPHVTYVYWFIVVKCANGAPRQRNERDAVTLLTLSGRRGVQSDSHNKRAHAEFRTGVLSAVLLVAASFAAAVVFSGAPLEAQPAKAGAGTR